MSFKCETKDFYAEVFDSYCYVQMKEYFDCNNQERSMLAKNSIASFLIGHGYEIADMEYASIMGYLGITVAFKIHTVKIRSKKYHTVYVKEHSYGNFKKKKDELINENYEPIGKVNAIVDRGVDYLYQAFQTEI